ncbi:MAG: GIY-YIG nuclease family protein [Candidatus Pacebacteria bacterium]|nr:GIY-YIG nuclease family protein [Candidatus Paceibacterota bacterium]
MTRDHASFAKLPDQPGVYFFVGAKREILYVGKASSLKDRVRSYFAKDLIANRGAHIVHMVDEAQRVDFRATDSVLEALILEANLIKALKPRYNTREKDDKSFNYLVITTHEIWPRLLTVRGKDLTARIAELHATSSQNSATPVTEPLVYGPFPHATQFKEALKIIRKIFPFYDTMDPVEMLRTKGDRKLRFNETIGIYPPRDTSVKEYAHTIGHIRLFFDGKKKEVLRSLERDMHRYARMQEFEEAERCKRQVFALQHINDVSLIRRGADVREVGDFPPEIRIEAYDVAHLSGKNMVGVMVVVEGGQVVKKEYRTFTIRSVVASNDTGALREILLRRLEHTEWQYPRLIVVDGGRAQMNVARAVLKEAGIEIPIVAVTKDEHHRPKTLQGVAKWRTMYANDVLLANAEAHRFSLLKHRQKRSKEAYSFI